MGNINVWSIRKVYIPGVVQRNIYIRYKRIYRDKSRHRNTYIDITAL